MELIFDSGHPKKTLKSTNQKKNKKTTIGKLWENQFHFLHSTSKAIIDINYSAIRKRKGDFMRFCC